MPRTGSGNTTLHTTDHETIRAWAEARGGTPVHVTGAEGGDDDPGIIAIDFPGYSGGDTLQEIAWDEWFAKFDDSDLVFLYQEETADGQRSNFNKLVKRSTLEDD